MKKYICLIFLFILLITTGCSKKAGQVVIYTSMEENRNKALKEQLAEKFPDKDIVVQYLSTGNSAAKIKNEGTNVEADIVLDLETAHMVELEENFADLSSFDTSIYLDGVNKSNRYLTWTKYTMALIIDKNYFDKHNLSVPKTYDDLLKSEYKNLIAIPDPKTSGTGYAFYLNVVNIMGEDKAIEYFKKLKNNLREFTTSGSGPTNLLKQGEIAIAMGMTSQGVEAINEGYNFKIVSLKTGAPYNTTSFGIIKGRENKENVREVFEWLMNDFGKYDKEYFLPDKILKNQEVKVKNYPTNLKDAKMDGIDSVSVKQDLISKWEKVNG
ncbi:MAG: extracellular solute-binding protein [Bacilli bacterium]|nr:extracellular solute-binding protein [Bacilli bacterium]MCI6931534.1 extracellular solute-binding protein [Mycoplasmatota bacterium]